MNPHRPRGQSPRVMTRNDPEVIEVTGTPCEISDREHERWDHRGLEEQAAQTRISAARRHAEEAAEMLDPMAGVKRTLGEDPRRASSVKTMSAAQLHHQLEAARPADPEANASAIAWADRQLEKLAADAERKAARIRSFRSAAINTGHWTIGVLLAAAVVAAVIYGGA